MKPGETPAGLDGAQHAAAQRAAHEAQLISQVLFPATMATALNLQGRVGSAGYKVYLERLLQDSGNPTDPIEVMMVQQLALLHFRLAQLHGSAGQAQGLEAVKIYNTAAARLLTEFRRTALALQIYRSQLPKAKPDVKPEQRLKLFEEAS